MGLRKLLKKARKAIGLPPITLKNAGKLAVAASAGPVALGGAVLASKLKSAAVGGVKQIIRTKSAKQASKKLDQLGPVGTVSGAATKMPGGAPIAKRIRKAKRARLPKVRQAKRPKSQAPYLDRQKRARAKKPASGAKRKPPTGGLDLKALSASWKAAGKPGTWQGWIAANK